MLTQLYRISNSPFQEYSHQIKVNGFSRDVEELSLPSSWRIISHSHSFFYSLSPICLPSAHSVNYYSVKQSLERLLPLFLGPVLGWYRCTRSSYNTDLEHIGIAAEFVIIHVFGPGAFSHVCDAWDTCSQYYETFPYDRITKYLISKRRMKQYKLILYNYPVI